MAHVLKDCFIREAILDCKISLYQIKGLKKFIRGSVDGSASNERLMQWLVRSYGKLLIMKDLILGPAYLCRPCSQQTK